MNELTKYFIQEYEEEQRWKDRQRANVIDMNDYFKDSRWREETRELCEKWAYHPSTDKRVYGRNIMHEYYTKKKENEKSKPIKKYRTKEGFEFVGES